MRTQQNIVKTDTRGTSEFSRDKTKPTKNRSEDAFETARCSAGARTAHREGLGASSGCPARLLDGSWPLLACRGRPKIGFGPAFGRPKAVPSASGRVPETAWALETAQARFFVDLGSVWGGFFVEFWTIFRRFTLEPRATKAHKQNLKKESRDPQRTSWLLSCGLASYCSHVFRSDFRTLYVQPFFVAYPQAHLV